MPVSIVRNGIVVNAESKDIKTGDILLIKEDEFFPADLVMLASCNDKANCLIKTSSLDGETAPKIKKVAKGLDWLVPSGSAEFKPDQLLCTAKVNVEPPNSNLYSFEGQMKMGGRNFYLDYEQMLLKGTQLMNTSWVLAFVTYTGKETRIMMNSQTGNVKQSDVEQMMNKFTIYVVTTLLILTLNLSIVGGFWQAEASIASQDDQVKEMNSHYYIEFDYDSMSEAFFTFVRYFQLLALFLPTSLFVSVEFVKSFMAYFIVSDV